MNDKIMEEKKFFINKGLSGAPREHHAIE